jgi:hypothetical protein
MRSVAIFLRVLGDILSCELGNVVDYRGCEQALLRAVTNQSISYKEEPQECSITREWYILNALSGCEERVMSLQRLT